MQGGRMGLRAHDQLCGCPGIMVQGALGGGGGSSTDVVSAVEEGEERGPDHHAGAKEEVAQDGVPLEGGRAPEVDEGHLEHLEEKEVKGHALADDGHDKLVHARGEEERAQGRHVLGHAVACDGHLVKVVEEKLVHGGVPLAGKLVKGGARRGGGVCRCARAWVRGWWTGCARQARQMG